MIKVAPDRLPARGHVVSVFESSTPAVRLETLRVDRLYARAAVFHSKADQSRDLATKTASERMTVPRGDWPRIAGTREARRH